MINLIFICLFLITSQLINRSEQINFGDKLPLRAYQELDFSNFRFETIKNEHKLNKRQLSLIDKPYLQTNRLSFYALNRKFNIFLKKETNLVADHVDIEVRYSHKPSEHLKDFFTSSFYTGIVENEPNSYVVCYFENKDSINQTEPLIFAQIHINNDYDNSVYYIEPLVNSTKYIIYKSNDINSDVISNGLFNKTVCHPKYVDNNENFNQTIKSNLDLNKRSKRQRSFHSSDSNKLKKERPNRCYLAVVADYKFYKDIGNSNVKLTTAYMMNVIAAINTIYTQTVWNIGDETTDYALKSNFGFSIEKVIVHTEPTIGQPNHYNSENSSTSADNVLELFGNEDWTSFCLAHLFTFQSFENSVLGLAYVSSPSPYSLGGICSNPTRSRGSKHFSVNTGLSSYKSASDKQGRLLQREAELVTAHEFGHNWGSEHDPLKPECTPSSSSGGNFIMYAYSNQGHEKNNKYFSPCSVNSISEVLKLKSTCFKGESLSYCGNDRIDEGEECDAGLRGRQGLDQCCDYNCRLKPGAQCSDSNHYCCKDCRIAPAGFKCYSSSNYIECFEDHSFCTGTSKDCPSQQPKKENTPCNSYDQGKCNPTGQCLSLCQQQDVSYFPCKCPNTEEKCMVCCRNVIANLSSECRPINQIFSSFSQSPIYLSNGRPCYDGLCENKICRQKVKDYVSRFWKVIQTVTVSGFVEFMKRNIVGSIIAISLTIWIPISCCLHFCIDKRQKAEYDQLVAQAKSNQERYQQRLAQRYNSDLSKESFNPDVLNEGNNRLQLLNIDKN